MVPTQFVSECRWKERGAHIGVIKHSLVPKPGLRDQKTAHREENKPGGGGSCGNLGPGVGRRRIKGDLVKAIWLCGPPLIAYGVGTIVLDFVC